MQKKIVLLMQWFDPEPQLKGIEFAKKIQSYGFDVEVLTGFPNYPGGKIYQGYTLKPYEVEIMDGIKVHRSYLYPEHSTSSLKRILNYVSFGISSFLTGILKLKNVDLIYACGPPVTVGVGACLWGLLKSKPVVYDIQDLWPETLSTTGMLKNRFALKVVESVCKFVYRTSKHIFVQSPGVRNALIRKGVNPDKISMVFNWCNEASSDDKSLLKIQPERLSTETFDILFAGTMGKAQALDAVINAAKILLPEIPKVRFLFLGGGIEVERLKSIVEKDVISNTTFMARVTMNEASAIMERASVLLVHLMNDPLFEITIPAKTQAYMFTGKPILMAVKGDAADLVAEAECGIYAEPENDISISNAVKLLYNMSVSEVEQLGINGKKYYSENLSMEVGVKKICNIFGGLIQNKTNGNFQRK